MKRTSPRRANSREIHICVSNYLHRCVSDHRLIQGIETEAHTTAWTQLQVSTLHCDQLTTVSAHVRRIHTMCGAAEACSVPFFAPHLLSLRIATWHVTYSGRHMMQNNCKGMEYSSCFAAMHSVPAVGARGWWAKPSIRVDARVDVIRSTGQGG